MIKSLYAKFPEKTSLQYVVEPIVTDKDIGTIFLNFYDARLFFLLALLSLMKKILNNYQYYQNDI